MNVQDIYRSKCVSVAEALAKIHSGDVVTTSFYGSYPRFLMQNLHTIADHAEDVTVWLGNPFEEYPFMRLPQFTKMPSTFYSAPQRALHAEGHISYAPHHLHATADCMAETCLPTVFLAAVTPPDADGYCLLSMSNQVEQKMVRLAERLIFEVNPRLPRVNGAVRVHVRDVDCFVETDYALPQTNDIAVTAIEQKIADHISGYIHDGDTIQFGIGGLPNALCEAFMSKNDLGVHTEMLVSSFARLMKAGVVNNSRKTLHHGQTVFAFAYGNQELYEYIDNNPKLRSMPVAYTNDPFVIAQNRNMVSVNAALEVDLTGQVCSESIGTTLYSGTGGATDFAYGAFHAPGGRGIVALNSTAKGGTLSRIRATLTPGATVSISRNIVDMVVTEYGVAKLRGCTLRQRAERLIEIAHPKFREELRADMKRLMIW